MKKILLRKIVVICAAMLVTLAVINSNAFAKKNVTVTPSKIVKIAKSKYHSKVNKYSQHYLGFNACLEKMGKKGGGTLTVNKGTYKICNAICVPSNVTIVFKKGVVFKKINKTGIKGQHAAKSMWQLVPKNKSLKKNSVKGYNGSKKVKMIAKGKVVFDMCNRDGICVVVCHNSNVEISGITFKGMNGNHYMEINGSKDVNIHHNHFKSAKSSTKSKNYNKEAINIDTPDSKTHGLPLKWVKHDLTPCKNLNIHNNTFSGTTRGVGTHKYSQKGGNNVYHEGIVIENNKFDGIFDNGIFVMNWKDAKICNNVFNNIGNSSKHSYSSGRHGISGGGVNGIIITGNKFNKIKLNPIYFAGQKNNKAGSGYKKIKNNITKEQLKLMIKNTATKCGYDHNDKYKGHHGLIFFGNGEREIYNAVGINFNKKKIWYGNDGHEEDDTPETKPVIEPTTEPGISYPISNDSRLYLNYAELFMTHNGAMVTFDMLAQPGCGPYDLKCEYGALEKYENNRWRKIEVFDIRTNGETYLYSERQPATFTLGINSEQGDINVSTNEKLTPGLYRYWQKTGEGNGTYCNVEFQLDYNDQIN